MVPDAGMLAGLFERSMGLGPEWEVSEVWFEGEGPGEPRIRVRRRPGASLPCPECGARCGACDTRERVWRHLDIWQFRTCVHCAVPRTDCPEHGPRTAPVPWEAPSSPHFTALFEAQVIAMAASGLTVRGIASLLGGHDARIWGLVCSAVGRARASADMSGVAAVGAGETARRRGRGHVGAFADIDARRVPCIAEGKPHEAVGEFAADLAAHGGDPAGVRVAAADLSQPFAKGAREWLPSAVRAADKFHVMHHFTQAVDKVRGAEGRGSRGKASLLAGTRFVWPRNRASLTEAQAARKLSLSRERLKTGRACGMKGVMQDIYARAGSSEEALPLIKSLSRWMRKSGIPQMEDVGRTPIRSAREVAAWFDHRRTNAMLEGVNSLIQTLKRNARGFGSAGYLKAAVYPRLGGLSFDCMERCATH